MPFDPKTNRFPYPLDTSSHYIKNKKDDHTVFDKDYCYLDKSKSFRFKRFFFRIVLVLIVFPMTRIRLNLKIIGRKNLKKYKDVLKDGVITVSNHIHMWDYLAIVLTLKHLNTNVLVGKITPGIILILLMWSPNDRSEKLNNGEFTHYK